MEQMYAYIDNFIFVMIGQLKAIFEECLHSAHVCLSILKGQISQSKIKYLTLLNWDLQVFYFWLNCPFKWTSKHMQNASIHRKWRPVNRSWKKWKYQYKHTFASSVQNFGFKPAKLRILEQKSHNQPLSNVKTFSYYCAITT